MTVLHPVPADPEATGLPDYVAPPNHPPRGPGLTAAAPKPGGWSAPEHTDETPRAYRARLLLAIALLVIITAADLLLITTTFNRILRDAEWVSWVLGASLTVASLAAAFHAGAYSRRADADPRASRRARTMAVGLGAGWAALGVGMFVLRWQAALFAPTAVAYDGAAAAALAEFREQVLAVVLAAVYLANGIIAYHDGHKLTNPALAALRQARARLDALLPKLQAQEGRVARLVENLEVATQEHHRLPEERATAVAAREALAEELKAHARLQIALHLGDPAATGGVRPPAAQQREDESATP